MANKRMILLLDLEFSDHADFDDAGIKEITESIAESIKKRADELGITPDGYETSLKYVRVTENYSNIGTVVNV